MNSRQLHYAVLLAGEGNFSLVAQKLNITQPALSKQILGLEKELGVQLFDRNTNPIRVTPAGEYFIKEAKALLYKEDQLLRSMEQFKTGDKGQLDIGITPFRSSYLIPKIAKKVRAKFPGVRIKLHEAGSEILRSQAAEGRFDFAVINLPVDETVFDFQVIEPDRLGIVIPNELALKFGLDTKKGEIAFKECEDLPFVVVGPNQEMRLLFENLCITNDFVPDIAAEVVGLTTAWEMSTAGTGATVLPLQFIKNEISDEKVSVFKIKDSSYLRQPAIVTRKGQYLSEAAKYTIKLLKEIY